MKKKVCFFVNTDDPKTIERTEFYKIDIQILKDLGFEIQYCFSYKRIPTNVDFYFIWWWTYAIFPIIKSKLKRKKSVITGTFNLANHIPGGGFYSRPFYQKFMIKQSVRWADANIFVSKFEFSKIQMEITNNKVFYSPHTFNLDKYKSRNENKRKKYIFTIAWMGKLNAQRKCIIQIIDAAKELKNRNYIIPFYIAGKVENDFKYVYDVIKEKKLDNMVHFLGPIKEQEKIDRLNECGIYLQPTKFEGFGMAIAEALLCSAPVITSKVGAVPEVTNNCCTYVKCDPIEIANSIQNIYNDYEKALQISRNGQIYVSENYPYERRKNDIKTILINEGLL
jgi:glycosyltransferase involved in cell wall biosynthesis